MGGDEVRGFSAEGRLNIASYTQSSQSDQLISAYMTARITAFILKLFPGNSEL